MHNEDDFQKFLALETEKQSRIINAAMKEFLGGFKKASTDVIVREAGISKGLLFHYFGTKEKLFDFLIDYAIGIVAAEFLEQIDVRRKDIFDSIWQMSLLKQDISRRFPAIFEFLSCVYLDAKVCPAKDHLKKFTELRNEKLAEVYEHCDKSLFRDDVDPQKAINIVQWTLQGWTDSKTAFLSPENVGTEMKENYASYLEEMREYLDIFRKCFYK
ncbi:MAG: TetR/AcrR family transcriptional regulator [Defluviitaleaceae bacterium]|nr:TetR/AcrR family transcriptional regulator [Defluviitaleaceae bacterium]MCL2262529.1 TetR/AcrR family transcriptional regulator [Defluviitaleaceae bacterium]